MMTAGDAASDSLVGALNKVRIPLENHEFIRQFTTAIDIDSYRAVITPDKSLVVATRREGSPDLHIYYGYTTGFTSDDEVVRCAGAGVERGKSTSRKGTWYVVHPVNRVRPEGERPRNSSRAAGFCSCGLQLSLTGVCGNCD